MAQHPARAAFNFQRWIADNREYLKPPVGNRHLFDHKTNMVVMVVGGPNQRVDFHDDPAEEFFFQVEGDIVLKIAEDGRITDLPIRAGEVFLAPPHLRHSPQRPAGSVGLVVEGARHTGMRDGFEWFCFGCGACVHRVEVVIADIVKDLPPLFAAFENDRAARTCRACGQVHPGKEPPPGWVSF